MEEPSQSVTVIEKPFCQKHVLTLRRHAAKNSSDFLRIIDSISVFPEESLASYQTRGISRSRVHRGPTVAETRNDFHSRPEGEDCRRINEQPSSNIQ
jgi:hypothetical protein